MARKKATTVDLGFLRGEDKRTDLSELFASSIATEGEMQQAIMVKIDRLMDNPYQPRVDTNAEGIEELSNVIKSQGFQGVLIARRHPQDSDAFQITAGHRRREAAKRAGLQSLPVVIRDLTEEEMITLAITENIQREDLSPLEEGRIYLLMSDEMGFTHEQVAREVGKKRGYIENRIRVARAPGDIQNLVAAKPDSLRAVANLIKVKDEGDRAEIISHILSGTLTVEDLPGFIETRIGIHSTEDALEEDGASIEASAHNGVGEPTGSAANSAALEDQAGGASTKPEPPLVDIKHSTRSAARIGGAKLAAVVRYLNTYDEQADKRASISQQERATLFRIKSMVDELCERYA